MGNKVPHPGQRPASLPRASLFLFACLNTDLSTRYSVFFSHIKNTRKLDDEILLDILDCEKNNKNFYLFLCGNKTSFKHMPWEESKFCEFKKITNYQMK